ncbi:MAG: hypothetical protein ACOX8E_01695 [Ruminococcus sp.]
MKWLEQEKNKLKGLSRRKKLEYVWQYYKLWLIGGAALLFLCVYFAIHLVNANRETYLYVGFVNTYAEVENGSGFWKKYIADAGVDTGKVNVIFDKEIFFDMTKGDVTGNHYYEKLVVLIDSQTLDAVVMEPDNLKELGANGRLMDLNNEKTAFLMEKYKDKLITTVVEEEDGTIRNVPVGIDLSDSILMTEEKIYTEGCALGISSQIKHVDAVEEFLEYLLQE